MDFIDSFPEAIDIPKAIHSDRHNIALANWWDTPETRFKQIDGTHSSTIPDITTWYCSCLVLSPRASRLLGPLLEKYGELLAVQVHHECCYIFNCLVTKKLEGEIDFDKQHSVLSPDLLRPLVFKDPSKALDVLICDDIFEDLLKEYDLEGLTLEQK